MVANKFESECKSNFGARLWLGFCSIDVYYYYHKELEKQEDLRDCFTSLTVSSSLQLPD